MAHTVANVQTNADKITNFALDKIQHLIDTASATLPKATHYALEVVSLQCIWNVSAWILSFVIFVLCLWLCLSSIKKDVQIDESNRAKYGNDRNDNCLYTIVAIVSGVIGVAAFGFTVFGFPYWSFIGINHPDLYVVHLALDKVLS